MKKAEELEKLADAFLFKTYNEISGDVCPRYAYKAGYTAALSTKTDKVQTLIDKLISHAKMSDYFDEDEALIEALKAYQTDEGE